MRMISLSRNPEPLKVNGKTHIERRFLNKTKFEKRIKKLKDKNIKYKRRTINVTTGVGKKYKVYQLVFRR